MHIIPGDPLARLSGDRPIALRRSSGCATATAWTGRCFGSRALSSGSPRGDLGTSIEYGRPVTRLISERLPATLLLGGTVLLLNFTVGLWLGVRQAVRKGKAEDRWLTTSRRWRGTPRLRSGSGLVLAWLVGVSGGCSPRPACATRCWRADAGERRRRRSGTSFSRRSRCRW